MALSEAAGFNCFHLPAHPRLQNVIAFQVASFVFTLLSIKYEIKFTYTLV